LQHLAYGDYKVKTPKGPEILHADSFKLYRPNLNGTSIPFHYYQPSAVPGELADEYVVEKILAHKIEHGKMKWLVKWRGYAKPDWQPLESFISGVRTDWMQYNKRHKVEVSLSSLPLLSQT
jgi:Chromo (CHRromatin Organisation MOdifier) domain